MNAAARRREAIFTIFIWLVFAGYCLSSGPL